MDRGGGEGGEEGEEGGKMLVGFWKGGDGMTL